MATLSEGSTASIVVYEAEGFLGLIMGPRVVKRYKAHVSKIDRNHEREIHEGVVYLLKNCALKAPMLEYVREALVMERVDTSRPLWECATVSEKHLDVLAEGLMALQKAGYEMRDVEVYVQPDDTLRILDFGQVTKAPYPLHAATMLLSATIVPASEVERLETAWAAKYLPKVKTLQEIYNLKHSDYVLGKCTRQEWENRETLYWLTERHLRWHNHMHHSGKHKMPDGEYAYLYLTGGGSEDKKPVYQTQAWKDWVKGYRAEFWKSEWGLNYEPLCAKDCQFRLPHCDCGELFHGMKLDRKLVPIETVAETVEAEPPAAEPQAAKADDDEDEVEQLSRLRR